MSKIVELKTEEIEAAVGGVNLLVDTMVAAKGQSTSGNPQPTPRPAPAPMPKGPSYPNGYPYLG